MKKFLIVLMSVAVIAAFFIVRAKVYDELIHGALTTFITPSEKFWVHRCNSVEKAQTMAEKFAGIEIDANFYSDENTFDISHDYNGSVQMPLENFMPVFAKTDCKIWFDFKNLTAENPVITLAMLENILANYNVDKARFVIESPNFNALKVFHDAGFYTSFYVTDIDKIREAVASGNVDAVSFPIDYYDAIKNLAQDVDYLTWQTHNERWWTFYRKENLRRIVDDEQVKIILVKMKTSYDRF